MNTITHRLQYHFFTVLLLAVFCIIFNGCSYSAENKHDASTENTREDVYDSEPDNYTYYCNIDTKTPDIPSQLLDISDIDKEMFDALLKFGDENCYDPFDEARNNSIETVDLPMPDKSISPELIFYKQSKDDLSTYGKGNTFHIINDSLFLLFYYDYGFGEYEKMVAVAVPDEISDYIVNFINTAMGD